MVLSEEIQSEHVTLLKAIQGAVFYQGAVEGFRSSVDSIRHCSLNTEVNTLPRWPTRLTSERATGRGTTINPGASENQLDTDLTVNELWDILPGMCLQVYCGPNESAGQLHKCAGHRTAAEAMDCDMFEMQQEASASWKWVNSHLLPVSFTFTLNQRCPSNSLYPSTHQLGHLYLCMWEMLLNKITCINYTFFSSFINWESNP